MKVFTNEFKQNIKLLGRELDDLITYTINGVNIELGSEKLNSVNPHYEASILKSVMKQLDIISKEEIPVRTEINYRLGIKVRNNEVQNYRDNYDYINYGTYVVMKSEKQEDTNSWKITCYDKMLYSMVNYEAVSVTYPTTIREYMIALCNKIGLPFANSEDEFVNYNKEIKNELYLNAEGESINYTFRDVLDEMAQVTASTICLNENNEIEIRYINDTNETIDEEYLKDINVNFGKKCGPINTVILSRASGADSIYKSYPEDLPDNEKIAIEISDNQVMNFNNRDEYIDEILEKLKGLEYYTNDFTSTGICYFDVCDRYNVSVDNNIYSCIMFNDDVKRDGGLVEKIHSDSIDKSENDFTKMDKTDRKMNQVYIIANKQEEYIESLVGDMYNEDGLVKGNFTRVYQDMNNIIREVQNNIGNNLIKNSVMFAYDENKIPSDWDLSSGGSLTMKSDTEALNAGSISGHSFTLLNKTASQRITVKADSDDIPEQEKTYYTFSTKIRKDIAGTCYVKIYNTNEEYTISLGAGESSYYGDYELKELLPKEGYYIIEFYGSEDSNATFTDNMFSIGRYRAQWQQANGEIMNTQVNINVNGVLVKSSIYAGDYTIMSPLEFAGYSNINGVLTKVFSLNKDTTEVDKLKSKNGISMPPIKIVPITTGARQGWAFVPTTEEV